MTASLGVFAAPYMQRALVAVVVVGVLAGVTGVYVVLRRMAFVADAMSHTVFPGVAIAFAMQRSLFLGAFVAGIVTALALTGLGTARRVGDEASLAILLTTMFAVGVVVVSRQHGFTSDLGAFLFGQVLSVSGGDLVLMAAVSVVSVAVLAAVHKELVLRAFDPDGAEAMGYRVVRLDLLLNLLVAGVMVTALRTVGTALAVALLITPAATARLVTRHVTTALAVSVGVAVVAGGVGLAVSWEASVRGGVRLSASATIVSVLTVVFAVTAVVTALARRPRPVAATA
jgi:manganese/iron transport system permease protein